MLCTTGQWDGGRGGSSLSAAGGGAGLLQAHRFAQPAGKIHFLHLRSFDERVVLKEKQSGAVSCTRLLLVGTDVSHLLAGSNHRGDEDAAVKHIKALQILTIRNFRTALSDGFLIRLHTHGETQLNADD